jgi:hypothetical protein
MEKQAGSTVKPELSASEKTVRVLEDSFSGEDFFL